MRASVGFARDAGLFDEDDGRALLMRSTLPSIAEAAALMEVGRPCNATVMVPLPLAPGKRATNFDVFVPTRSAPVAVAEVPATRAT